jgi:hypothetical protein
MTDHHVTRTLQELQFGAVEYNFRTVDLRLPETDEDNPSSLRSPPASERTGRPTSSVWTPSGACIHGSTGNR